MQQHSYPLPPLMLTPIIEKCAEDHTHKHYDGCFGEDAEYCADATKDDESNIMPVITRIEPGYGRHVCDDECAPRTTASGPHCFGDCDDSDWIVELQYSSNGWRALYGITRHGDIQDISLWQN